MGQRTEDLSSLISNAIQANRKDLHTCIPGIVESFDAEKQTLEVQPAISRVFSDGSELPLPKLINVPLIIPHANGFSLTLPVVKGDECLVMFSERSIDNWLSTGEIQSPNDIRFHDLSDGFALLGINSSPNVIPTYDTENMQLRNEDASVVITVKSADEIEVKTPTLITLNTPTVQCTGDVLVDGQVLAKGNVESEADVKDATGTLDSLRGNYNDHKHTTVAVGQPTSPTDSPDP